jgi:hypothetical protein
MCAANGMFHEKSGAASATTIVFNTDVLALCASPALNAQPWPLSRFLTIRKTM